MFGSEGERLQELRHQQARQYAEQLREQIAAKNSQKPKSPALYSTTTSDSYSIPVNQYQKSRVQITNLNASQQSQNVISISAANSTDRLQRPTLNPLPDLQPTSIAPLNLMITQFHPDPTPSLPRQQMNSISQSADKSTFNERIRSLESILDQQRLKLTKSTESASRILKAHYPTIENSINDVQTRVNRFINTELNQKILPLSDLFLSDREFLDSESMKIKSSIENLREFSSEIGTSISQFNSIFNDTIDSIKGNASDVKNDNNRLIDSTDLLLTKLLQIENKESIINDNASKNSHNLEYIDDNISTSFSMLQQSANDIMSSVSSQIAREIKAESDSREHITNSLYSQVLEVNQNASDSITRLHSLSSEMNSNFKGNIQSLSDSVGVSLNIIQNELDSCINDIGDQINSLIQNSEGNFGILQSEIISTINILKDVVTQTINTIEEGIDNEVNIQKKNKIEINAKFDNFDLVINREMNIQLQHLDEIGNQTIEKGKEVFNRTIQDSKTQLILLKQNDDKINAAESKLNEIEKSFESASFQVNESLQNLSSNYKDLAQKYTKIKNSAEDSFNDIEQKLESQENQKPTLYSRRDEVIDLEKKINNSFEKKISEIESQLSLALTYLAELSVQRSDVTKKERPWSGIEKIRDLANKADALPSFDESGPSFNSDATQSQNSEYTEADESNENSYNLEERKDDDDRYLQNVENKGEDEIKDDEVAHEKNDDNDDEKDGDDNYEKDGDNDDDINDEKDDDDNDEKNDDNDDINDEKDGDDNDDNDEKDGDDNDDNDEKDGDDNDDNDEKDGDDNDDNDEKNDDINDEKDGDDNDDNDKKNDDNDDINDEKNIDINDKKNDDDENGGDDNDEKDDEEEDESINENDENEDDSDIDEIFSQSSYS